MPAHSKKPKTLTVRVNGQSYEEMLSHRSTIALTKKTITLAPKRTVAGLGEAHWIKRLKLPGFLCCPSNPENLYT